MNYMENVYNGTACMCTQTVDTRCSSPLPNAWEQGYNTTPISEVIYSSITLDTSFVLLRKVCCYSHHNDNFLQIHTGPRRPYAITSQNQCTDAGSHFASMTNKMSLSASRNLRRDQPELSRYANYLTNVNIGKTAMQLRAFLQLQ